jgi:putative heme-binding domain-containing protein
MHPQLLLFLLTLCQEHGSSTTVNPYVKPEDAASGAALFRKQCAGCHGPDGAGAGAGPSLVSGTFRRGGSDEQLFQTIAKGVPGTTMPAFALTGLQTWQLVTHLRAISVAGRAAGALTGDAVSGGAIFRERCAGCHRTSAPDLSGIGARKSLEDLRKSILQPDAAVPPEYWRVRIRTAKGESVTGTRLNEDTHSIQIRDAQGRLRSFLSTEIAQVEWIRTSPMPAPKLEARQLDDLLAYVATLPQGGRE